LSQRPYGRCDKFLQSYENSADPVFIQSATKLASGICNAIHNSKITKTSWRIDASLAFPVVITEPQEWFAKSIVRESKRG
jgi:hypothetical protein